LKWNKLVENCFVELQWSV